MTRKKSPRAPSIPLDEAIERASRAYDKERLHAAPTEVVAQNIGYKGSSSGAALAALASLRYYGLLERPSEGLLAVTKDVEAYKFAPSEELKRSFLLSFLRKPPLFADLLDKYASGLPSDANMKYDLIQRGFLPATAGSLVQVFRRSAEFAGFYEQPVSIPIAQAEPSEDHNSEPNDQAVATVKNGVAKQVAISSNLTPEPDDHDRIPVRLSGGRRAWLLIPTPFYMADKDRLKAQIDLLLTEDDE